MSEYEGPTLAKWPEINDFNLLDYSNSHMIRAMQQTGFQKWGFVIYRCTYTDDMAWKQYIERMSYEIQRYLEATGTDLLLAKYLDMTIIEDPSTLDNASIATVREQFKDWVTVNQHPGYDGPDARNRFVDSIPRFNYCIYVDQKCLDTLAKRLEWDRLEIRNQPRPSVVCAMIDVNCEQGGEGRDGYPSLDGCTKEYPGWMYTSFTMIAGLYDGLHKDELGDEYGNIVRPPKIYPVKIRQTQTMPV